MQKELDIAEFTEITPTAAISVDRQGGRAKCLQRLMRLDLPVPETVAVPFATVKRIAGGQMADVDRLVPIQKPSMQSLRLRQHPSQRP